MAAKITVRTLRKWGFVEKAEFQASEESDGRVFSLAHPGACPSRVCMGGRRQRGLCRPVRGNSVCPSSHRAAWRRASRQAAVLRCTVACGACPPRAGEALCLHARASRLARHVTSSCSLISSTRLIHEIQPLWNVAGTPRTLKVYRKAAKKAHRGMKKRRLAKLAMAA